jgi:hypothetical protein
VPDEAKTHLFLMHSLLALSALHLSVVRRDKKHDYERIAHQQHRQARANFNASVPAINCANGNAVTAFSFLTVVYSVGVPVVNGFSETLDSTAAFIEILGLLRQAYSVVHPVFPEIAKGPLGQLIEGAPGAEKSCPMHVKGREILDSLGRLNEGSSDSDEHKAIHRQALAKLYKFLDEIQDAPPLWVNSLKWPSEVSPEFFQLLKEKRPFALVLLAHWCVPVYRTPSLWFNAWAQNIVAEVSKSLEEEWKCAVIWPAEQVGIIPRKFHAQPCLCLQCCICKDCSREFHSYNRPHACENPVSRGVVEEVPFDEPSELHQPPVAPFGSLPTVSFTGFVSSPVQKMESAL